MILRHNKFSDIKGLDQEIDLILKAIDEQTGRVVKELPNVKSVGEFAKFFVKQTDGTYFEYKKIGQDYYILKGDGSSAYWEKI